MLTQCVSMFACVWVAGFVYRDGRCANTEAPGCCWDSFHLLTPFPLVDSRAHKKEPVDTASFLKHLIPRAMFRPLAGTVGWT